MNPKLAITLLAVILVAGSGMLLWQKQQQQTAIPNAPSSSTPVLVETVTENLVHPWGMAFLPGGRALVTERPGRIRIVSTNGSMSPPIQGVPAVFNAGQGGLLDVAIDPDFATNRRIYLSYAEAEGNLVGTAVARAEFRSRALQNLTVIFRQHPKVAGDKHFGSRLVFAPDHTLYVALGERFEYRDQAQALDNYLGKIVRIDTNGAPMTDNPFVYDSDKRPEIWSYGHRNIQGAAINPATGALWVAEHGAKGGDEINIIQSGGNYGWPQASYGSHYDGTDIPDEHASRGFIEPIYYWTPSIAPSGMLFYTGNAFPQWKGSLLVGALAGKRLTRLELNGNEVVREEELLAGSGNRIRDVEQGPDGFIYLLTDAKNGKLLRLKPQP